MVGLGDNIGSIKHTSDVIAESLSAIQRAIASGAPLDTVLDAITEDAWGLLGRDQIIGLRIVDPDDSDYVLTLAARGVDSETLGNIRRRPIYEGVGGRAIRENALVLFEDYSVNPEALDVFAESGVQAAMAAPIRENGRAIGSLAIASHEPDRTYSAGEQMSLLTFAEHASLAIAAAKVAERMRDAERDRQMFLAMVTHKLKTPLTVMAGSVELLSRWDELDARRRELILEQGRKSVRDISRMIDKLLKGSRAELQDDQEEMLLRDAIRAACDGFENLRPLQVEDIPDVTFNAKAEAFRQALGTLLENAVKHSPEASPIRIEARAGTGHVGVLVHNEGSLPAGIDPSDLFQPLQQGHAVAGGVGLGLYIVKRLARSMGGDVSVAAQGPGVTFELRLPRN